MEKIAKRLSGDLTLYLGEYESLKKLKKLSDSSLLGPSKIPLLMLNPNIKVSPKKKEIFSNIVDGVYLCVGFGNIRLDVTLIEFKEKVSKT